MTSDSYPVRRRLVGAALRAFREALGFEMDDVAQILGCDRSKVSRIETGQRGIRCGELRELLTEYGAGTAAESRLADPAVAGAAGLSAEQAAAIGAGQLDMGLTNCRDPYDSPHTPAGTLCHVAPAMCMLCRNAVIFTAQLPRLVQLAGHIQAQRDVLDPPRWQAVWGRQAAALAELFDACPEETSQARAAAAASPPLDLPLGMRTEYHR